MRLPKNWADVKTRDFIRIYNIITSEDYDSNTDRLIDIAAALLNVPVAQLDNLQLTALYKLDFLLHPETIPNKVPRYFYLKGRLYKPQLNIPMQWSSGMYIDVSEYTKHPDKIIGNMHRLMATVCLPCNWWGRTRAYNGDEAEARAALFYNELPITLTYPVTLFFCNNWLSLMHATQTYLEGTIQTEMKALQDLLPAGAGTLPLMPLATETDSSGNTLLK